MSHKGHMNRNLIIFDWDDTLFCSTWLCESRANDSTATMDDLQRMEELGESIEKTLSVASQYGEVIIVTNAQEQWVELSTEYYMPNLASSLSNYRIVSARSRYQSIAGNDPHIWKKYAFSAEITRFIRGDDACGSVFSIGDSSHERLALHSVSDTLEGLGRFTKSIKLMERPQLEDLINQQALVRVHFQRLVEAKQSFDICIVERPHNGSQKTPGLTRSTSLTDARSASKNSNHPSLNGSSLGGTSLTGQPPGAYLKPASPEATSKASGPIEQNANVLTPVDKIHPKKPPQHTDAVTPPAPQIEA